MAEICINLRSFPLFWNTTIFGQFHGPMGSQSSSSLPFLVASQDLATDHDA